MQNVCLLFGKAMRLPRHAAGRRGFTLVELLVVIGIIAVLIAVLLPALASARESANATKCAAQLRQIGAAFFIYASEQRGFFPTGMANFPGGYGGSWAEQIAPYLTRQKRDNSSGVYDYTKLRNTVLSNCPSWSINNNGDKVTDYAYLKLGYGMNSWPSAPTPRTSANQNIYPGGMWYRQSQWTKPSARLLVADSWNSGGVPLLSVRSVWPGTAPPQHATEDLYYGGDSIQNFDRYRHGKKPSMGTPDSGGVPRFSVTGGKVAYNALFCDGSVRKLTSLEEGWKAISMEGVK